MLDDQCLHGVSCYDTSDTKRNNLLFRLVYQFIPNSRWDIYEQTYHWQISFFLKHCHTRTQYKTAPFTPLHKRTAVESHSNKPHYQPIQTTGCCCSASFAFLRVRAQGDQHKGNRFHQHYDCDSGACITRILILGRFLLICTARPINGLLRQIKAIAKHNKCPSH